MTNTLSRLGFVSFLSTLAWAVPVAAQAPVWDFVWSDEFDGSSVDTGEWDVITLENSFNNEKQYYLPGQASIADGNLRITATDQPFGSKQYRSARLESVQAFDVGRFEARIDLPTTQGMWPAFWLLPNAVAWPTGGEIDILENRGSQPNLVSSAYHWQTNPGPCCDQHQFVFDEYTATEGGQPVNFHSSFHTYAAEWEFGEIRFFVDGNLYHTVTQTTDRPIFATPKNIILNLAVGGDFGGDPNGSTVFPQNMDVDYVRVWERDTDQFYNGSFEQYGGGTGGWSRFGESTGNVSAASEAVLDGSRSLKLWGQFNGSYNESGAWQGITVSEGDLIQASASSFVRSADSIAGTNNSVTMRLEFYDTYGATSAGSLLDSYELMMADGSVVEDVWDEHALSATAPAGAVEARVVFSFLQPSNQGGAVHIDQVSLVVMTGTQIGDYNGDGLVDASDYTVWRDTLGQTGLGLAADGNGNELIEAGDYSIWKEHFGDTFPPSGGGAALPAGGTPVPEPGSIVFALAALLTLLSRTRAAWNQWR